VVSDEETAPLRCQVGTRKANVSESLTSVEMIINMTSKPGFQVVSGMSLAGAR
jgi:hypothetical protein